MRCLLKGLSALGLSTQKLRTATATAISRARARLGVEPLERLYEETVRSIATPETRGARYQQWKLVSIDGTMFDIADTPENDQAFGQPSASRGQSAFPQVRLVTLLESGTHVMFATQLGPYSQSEAQLAKEVLQQLQPGMLCLADRGYCSYELFHHARETGAELLWWTRKDLRLPVEQCLLDGFKMGVGLRAAAPIYKPRETRMFRILPASLVLVFFLFPAHAEEEAPAEPRDSAPKLAESQSVTRHSFTLDGRKIDYTATAGTLLLENEKQEPEASVFYIAYTRDGADDPAKRPVTFSFNGGPGAAAVWVNLGAFGPKKVKADDEGFPTPPPGELVDNPYSILDATDLVFIDPVETGLSRKAEDAEGSRFHGLKADVESVGRFIRLWITRSGRWASPKFIAGESYGTTRAAGLADHLQQTYGMYLNGVVMISSILNWQNQSFNVGNDMAYLIHLPTYTATARYHGKLAPELAADLGKTLEEVERFALTDYALALHQGDALDADERRRIAEALGRYTGLSVDYVERSNLRIVLWRFLKELLREEGRTVGRLDSRFTGHDRDSAGEAPEYDPSSEAVSQGYVTLMNDYLRRELEYETDLVYRSLAEEVFPWKWEGHNNRFVNVAEDLRRAMVRNPNLRVLFTSGYYDFATPYFDTKYTVNHLSLPEELRGNVTLAFYEAGHMMYIRKEDHAKLKKDVVEFMERALGQGDQ